LFNFSGAGALAIRGLIDGILQPNASFSLSAVASALTSFGVTAFPDGFTPLQLTGAAGVGLNLSTSITGDIDGDLTTPSLATGIDANSQLRVLYYDPVTQTYVQLPNTSFSLNSFGQIVAHFSRSGTYFFTQISNSPIFKQINSSVLLAANSSQNFAVQEDGHVRLIIKNIIAQAGLLAVNISSRFAAEAAYIRNSSTLRSTIYSINHNNGGSAVTSATLSFNLTVAGINISLYTLGWFKFDPSQNNWLNYTGQIRGDALEYTTNGFSDWSVLSATPTNGNNAGTSSATNTGTSSGLVSSLTTPANSTTSPSSPSSSSSSSGNNILHPTSSATTQIPSSLVLFLSFAIAAALFL